MWNLFGSNPFPTPTNNTFDQVKIEYMSAGLTWKQISIVPNNPVMVNLALMNAKRQYGTMVRAVNSSGQMIQMM